MIFTAKGNSWFKNIYKDILNQGVTEFGGFRRTEVHPSTILHGNGKMATKFTIFTEWIGQNWSKKVLQKLLPKFSSVYFDESRLFWCSKKWARSLGGDVSKSWGGLQSQPDIVLQMGLQGIAFMHSDLGGFAGKNEDDELYARWFAIRRFQPNLQTSYWRKCT